MSFIYYNTFFGGKKRLNVVFRIYFAPKVEKKRGKQMNILKPAYDQRVSVQSYKQWILLKCNQSQWSYIAHKNRNTIKEIGVLP